MDACASNPAAVFISEVIDLFKYDRRLMFLDPELTDPVIDMDLGVPHCKCRHIVDIIVSAIALIDHTHMVGLDDPEIFIG